MKREKKLINISVDMKLYKRYKRYCFNKEIPMCKLLVETMERVTRRRRK